MDDHRITEDGLRQAIDACRPDSGDERAADLAALLESLESNPRAQARFERSQALDRKIEAALSEVPVPSDLSNKILARLRLDVPRLASLPDATSPARRRAMRWVPRSRRAWGAVAAMMLLALTLFLLGRSRPVSTEELLTFAGQESAELSRKWNSSELQPKDFALPRAVSAGARRWQRVANFLNYPAVAYELVDASGSKATLFVVDMQMPSLPSAPPLAPQLSTGGRGAAAWTSKGRVYVLVLPNEDAVRRYRRFVSPSSPTLARAARQGGVALLAAAA